MTALALVLALALGAAPADSVDVPCPGGRVLTRAELEASGANHLHDVLRLTGLVDAVTVDGYDAVPVAAWGRPAPPRVLVDGAPAAAGTSLEPTGLEALPVMLGEVARVAVCPGPGVAGGVWGGPWIDLQTAPPAPLAYGAVDYGNETGDPGPDRYLDPSLPNVDHWGPDAEAALVVPGGAAWAALRDHRILPTDAAIAPRVFAAVVPGYYPVRAQTTGAVALQTGGASVRVGGIRGIDLPHVTALGREVPVSRRSVQATAAGARAVGGAVVRGHVHAARLTLDRPAWGRLALPVGWTETRVNAALSARAGRLAAGIQAEGTAAAGPGLDDGTLGVGRMWAQAGRPARRLTVQASASGSGVGVGGALDAARRLGGTSLRLTLALDRTRPEARPDLALWTRRGYTGLAGAGGLPALDPGPPRPSTVALVRLGAAGQAGGIGWEASADAHAARGPFLRPALVAGDVAVQGTFQQVETEGLALLARVAAWGGAGRLALRASAQAQGAVVGDQAHRDAWRRRPSLRARAEATFRPDARLALWAAVEARTATEWAGYPDPDVPGTVVLDLAASKRAWGERLRLSLTARNALGAAERTHPLGAILAPRLFGRAEVRW